MNIVIIGAGTLARYVAAFLSKEQHNVIVLDQDLKKLEAIRTSMDVGIRHGSGTDWQLLDDLLEISPDFLIALTNNDEINLSSCAIAKQLGYKKTMARVQDNRFLNRSRLDFGQIFYIDAFISPELLVAQDILLQLTAPHALGAHNYAHGAVQLRKFILLNSFKQANIPLKELSLPDGVVICLIVRQNGRQQQFIFPHGEEVLRVGDEVTCIGLTESMEMIMAFFGIVQEPVRSVVIVGGTLTSLNLSRELERKEIQVRLIEKDYERCVMFAETLDDTTIIHHDGTDIDFYYSEKISASQAFIAMTKNDATNVLVALLAKEVGCEQVIAQVSNTKLAPILKKYGVHHTISPLITIGDEIISRVLSDSLTAMTSLYENQAEVLEITVSDNAKVTGIPISDLGELLPDDFLIAVIQNRGRVMIAVGSRIISPGDTVIAITHPRHIETLKTIF